jgi:hypothetical protein
MLSEFLEKITSLTQWEILGDVHGGVAMLTLVLFGVALMLYFSYGKFSASARWLKNTLLALFACLVTIDLLGLFIYVPYRATTGPKATLIASESTAWLHEIMFEHKEFVAFAPIVLIFTAYLIVKSRGKGLNDNPAMKRAVLFSIIAALVFVLVVASEAVLITKVAPLK